jgi:hypothetical protein
MVLNIADAEPWPLQANSITSPAIGETINSARHTLRRPEFAHRTAVDINLVHPVSIHPDVWNSKDFDCRRLEHTITFFAHSLSH